MEINYLKKTTRPKRWEYIAVEAVIAAALATVSAQFVLHFLKF